MKKLLGLTLAAGAMITGCGTEKVITTTAEVTDVSSAYDTGTAGMDQLAAVHGQAANSTSGLSNQLFAAVPAIESCRIDFEVQLPPIDFLGRITINGYAVSDATKVMASLDSDELGVYIDTVAEEALVNLEALKAFDAFGSINLPTWYNDGWSVVDETLPADFIEEVEKNLLSCGDIPKFYGELMTKFENAPAEEVESIKKSETETHVWFEAEWNEVVDGEDRDHYIFLKFDKETEMPVEFKMNIQEQLNINAKMSGLNTTVVEKPTLAPTA